MTVIARAISDTADAAWFGTWAQIAAAFFTLAAVVTAIWIAVHDASGRRREERSKRQAQANLVTIGRGQEKIPGDGAGDRLMSFDIFNHSDTPILLISAETWGDAGAVESDPQLGDSTPLILPGKRELLQITTDSWDNLDVPVWRVRWTDHHGQQWFVDHDHAWPKQYPQPVYGRKFWQGWKFRTPLTRTIAG